MLTLNSQNLYEKETFFRGQIIKTIKDQDTSKDVITTCRELSIHKALQEENSKLKAMNADLALDHRILKEIVEKKI